MNENSNAYRVWVGKPEGKRPRGRHSLRWGDNIKMDIYEILWDCVDWMYLAQDVGMWWAPLVNRTVSLRVP
jgi:hypothetical protein